MKALIMDKQTIKAQIDVCGKTVSYVAENAYGAVNDEIMLSLNQAIIALEDAYNRCDKEEE